MYSRICSFEDNTKIIKLTEKQKGISILGERVYNQFIWADSNDMLFNNDKFQLRRYGTLLIGKKIKKSKL